MRYLRRVIFTINGDQLIPFLRHSRCSCTITSVPRASRRHKWPRATHCTLARRRLNMSTSGFIGTQTRYPRLRSYTRDIRESLLFSFYRTSIIVRQMWNSDTIFVTSRRPVAIFTVYLIYHSRYYLYDKVCG